MARYLCTTKIGLLCIDRTVAPREAHLDGKFLLRTSDETPLRVEPRLRAEAKRGYGEWRFRRR